MTALQRLQRTSMLHYTFVSYLFLLLRVAVLFLNFADEIFGVVTMLILTKRAKY